MFGRLASLEALLVWESPQLNRVSPSMFIPIAEETGMILPIGRWVLQQACNQMAGWRAAGFYSNYFGRQRFGVAICGTKLRFDGCSRAS